jgi:hypothetical protein
LCFWKGLARKGIAVFVSGFGFWFCFWKGQAQMGTTVLVLVSKSLPCCCESWGGEFLIIE